MDELLSKYDEKFENDLINRICKYNAIDLLSKVSCASFFLRTSIFANDKDTFQHVSFSKCAVFLTSLFVTKGMNLGGSKIGYTELLSIAHDVMMFTSIRGISLDDEIESIAMSQSSKSEVLEYFRGYYISTLLQYEEEVLQKMGLESDAIVQDIFEYLGKMYDISNEVNELSFKQYIENFDTYNKCKFEYDGKYKTIYERLAAENGGHPELYIFNSPFYAINLLRCCFLEIDNHLFCFVPEIITGCLPKFLPKLIPCELRINWFDNRKKWSEESVAMLFKEYFPGVNIYMNNYFFPISKKHRNENDLIVSFKGYLFIVEIKAANVTPDSVYLKPNEVIDSYTKQIDEGIDQCNIVENIINEKGLIDFYDEDNSPKTTFKNSDYEEIFKITVTFEEMGSFLPGYLIRKENINYNIVVNFYDLYVILDYLNNPALAIKYFQERKNVIYKDCLVHDELVFLGMFTLLNVNYSTLINDMVKEPPFTNNDIGYMFLPENEFMPKIENYYANHNSKKVDFTINKLILKSLNVNYRNISNLEMSHLVGLINMPYEEHDKIEAKYTNSNSMLVLRFNKINTDINYAIVIKKTKTECLITCANYFPTHLDVNEIVIVYFEGEKTKISTVKRKNQELKKYLGFDGYWKRTVEKGKK